MAREQQMREEQEITDHLVSISRVTKVVKGGKRMSFAAVVIAGDRNGRVGLGHGKAREVPDAITKALNEAKGKMRRVPLREGRTLHHEMRGRYGSGKVVLRPAPAGTGIIAGGPLRMLFEALGVQDVVAKSLGSSNPHNMIKAVFAAFDEQQTPKSVANKRGKRVKEIFSRTPGGEYSDDESTPAPQRERSRRAMPSASEALAEARAVAE